MKREYVNERRQAAARMEAIMLAASLIGLFITVIVFLAYGLLAGFAMVVLTLVSYGLSRVFDFISDLLTGLRTDEEDKTDTQRPNKSV